MPWQKVETGEIVRLVKDDHVPADIVVLSSSEEDSACFIETADLDGETNLKKRYALAETREANSEEELVQLDCTSGRGKKGPQAYC